MRTGALRFDVGARVACNLGAAGWTPGIVVAHNYAKLGWPPGQVVPYQVQLDDGGLIFAPEDSDECVRAI